MCNKINRLVYYDYKQLTLKVCADNVYNFKRFGCGYICPVTQLLNLADIYCDNSKQIHGLADFDKQKVLWPLLCNESGYCGFSVHLNIAYCMNSCFIPSGHSEIHAFKIIL